MKKFFILVSIALFLLTTGTASAGTIPIPLPPGSVGDFVGDIHQKSQPRSSTCSRCNGSGKITKTKIVWSKLKKRPVKARQIDTCPKCSGRGRTDL